MSVQAMGWVLEFSETVGNARLVMLSIANHAGARGENAYPSMETIAREARIRSRATVISSVAAAEGLLELYVYTHGGPANWTGGQRPNRYELPLVPGWVAPTEAAPREPKQRRESRAVGGLGNGATFGSQPRDITGQRRDFGGGTARPVAPKPSLLEPSLEPSLTEPSGDVPFEAFWLQYPKRSGQRLGKSAAVAVWARLNAVDRGAATTALALYARVAGGYPKDAERYLRHRLWEDLAEREAGSGIRDNVARLAERARKLTEGDE